MRISTKSIYMKFNIDENKEWHTVMDLKKIKGLNGFMLTDALDLDNVNEKNITDYFGKHLIEFLNLQIEEKDLVQDYFISKYGLNAFKGIYESKKDIELEDKFVSKEEYVRYCDRVFEVCYEDIKEAHKFFTDYIMKLYNYINSETYNNIDSKIRELYIMHETKNNGKLFNKYESYIRNDMLFTVKQENNKTQYTFASDNILAILYATLKYLPRYKSINRCVNCGDFFVPTVKSNEIFCQKVYPDGTSCKSLGTNNKLKAIMKEDEARRLYKNLYQKKLMYCKRNPLDITAQKEFENWKVVSQELLKKYKKGKIDKDYFIDFLTKE